MENDEVIGNIILRVHDDLNHLQEKINLKQNQDHVNVNDIKDLLASTQQGLKKHAEEVLNHINNQVTSYSTLDQIGQRERSSAKSSINQDRLVRLQKLAPWESNKSTELIPIDHVSPGELMKRDLALRSISNPHNRLNRQFASEKFGIQLPLIQEKIVSKTSNYDAIQKGSIIQRLEKLPLETNRNYNTPKASKITELDAQRGLLNLIERGLIPPNARITFDPPAINKTVVPILSASARHRTNIPAGANEQGFSVACYQLDDGSNDIDDYLDDDADRKQTSLKSKVSKMSKDLSVAVLASSSINMANIRPNEQPDSAVIDARPSILHNQQDKLHKSKSSKTIQFNKEVIEKEITKVLNNGLERQETMPPPTTPASLLSKSNMDSCHKFTISNGKTRQYSDDFIKFKRHYCLVWGSITTVIESLEELLAKFSIPIAFINGDIVADLSVEYELEMKPSEQELTTCIINRDDVLGLMEKPGRRFLGDNGRQMAATVIQSKWRGFVDRKYYLDYRRKRCAAGVIAIKWILHMKMAQIHGILERNRMKYLNNFRKRDKIFSSIWPKCSVNRRVIIHLPSLGIDETIRYKLKKFQEFQNHQMTRICDLKDPNVDVIYVSPVPVNDELLQYFSKLFSLKSAVDSGNANDQKSLNARYKIIVPEAVKSFPCHNMCLSTVLKYSPRALKRIKLLIKGRSSWIVPGIMHIDDLEVANYLEVPILGTEPGILTEFNSKSGVKKVLDAAKVDVAPSENNIVSMNELYESLAQLITDNLQIKKWILKTNNDIKSHGIGYIDIDQHLTCYSWAQKEQRRYGEKWSKRWAQESAYNRILGEIPKIVENYLKPVNQKRYGNATKFLAEFIKQGGVIQAYPSSDSVTNITVSMFIDPVGNIQMIGSGDQIHDGNGLNAWGYSVPQSSIDAEVLNKSCYQIAETCKVRDIKGYLSIDFVTFIEDNKEDCQKLWAIDIDFQYCDLNSMTNLVLFATNANFLPSEHNLTVNVISNKSEPSLPLPRYVCVSTQLSHSNLAMVHYSVFFQMCRAHGIGFDIKEKQGTIFSLIDSFNRENITMISIGPSLESTLETFAKNLYILHQEISSPNMPGRGNFNVVIKEIENILGLAIENTILAAESKVTQ